MTPAGPAPATTVSYEVFKVVCDMSGSLPYRRGVQVARDLLETCSPQRAALLLP